MLLTIAFTVIGVVTIVTVMQVRRLLSRAAMLEQRVIQTTFAVEESQRIERSLRQDVTRLQDRLDEARKSLQRAEKAVDDSRQRQTKDAQEARDALSQAEHFERRASHLDEQVTVLTRQLTDSDRARSQAETALNTARKDADLRLGREGETNRLRLAEVEGRVRQAEQRNQQLERELKAIKERTRELDPEVMTKLKRKASHYHALYEGMRGLRTMADERTKNWETALEQLARWVVEQKRGDATVQSLVARGVGPLVGEALELIGSKLVDDSAQDASSSPISSSENETSETSGSHA